MERFVPQPGNALFAKAFLRTQHRHHCADGGRLHDFALGSFIWLPQGMQMERGARQAEDVTVLFVTNKKFDYQRYSGLVRYRQTNAVAVSHRRQRTAFRRHMQQHGCQRWCRPPQRGKFAPCP
jgi:hypothetical protein